jgi:hypothetical protein
MQPDAKTVSDYEKMGLKLPSSTSHNVTPEEIRARMKRLTTTRWRLAGNQLTCDTEMGELVQTIPTNYILTGEDSEGLPTFKKIG